MSLTTRRFHSTASSIASSFLSTIRSHPPQTRVQTLDINQIQRLNATLSRPEQLYDPGTTIPPCYHLAYFTPSDLEEDLGADGSDRTYNPPKPFTRRMWAGGELEWMRDKHLRVGQSIIEKTELKSAQAKTTRAGEDMIVVGVEKTFEDEQGLNGVALIDRRNWIFRREIDPHHPITLAPKPPAVPLPSGEYTRDITQTPVRLFRFSALTFNAHKIHYNREWCRTVEGHRDLVVHGPLNLIHMLDFWRDAVGKEEEMFGKKVVYRATSPFYVGETYRIVMSREVEKSTEVKIVDGFGNVGMRATIERF